MRKYVSIVLLTAACIAAAAVNGAAQEKRLSSAGADFRAFYSSFIAAVHKGDKTAVASMTSFPLKYGFDTGDEGKYTRSRFFNTGFKRMFGRSPDQFLKERDPMVSGHGSSYTVTTEDATHLVFTRRGKTYIFTAYIVEP